MFIIRREMKYKLYPGSLNAQSHSGSDTNKCPWTNRMNPKAQAAAAHLI